MKMNLTFTFLRVLDIFDEIESWNPAPMLSRSPGFRIEILLEVDVENRNPDAAGARV
jgi:hypothetical protein